MSKIQGVCHAMGGNTGISRSPERQGIIEDFYRNYNSILHRFFMRRVRNHTEADDLTQDALIRVTQQVDREEIQNPDSFIFTVAANLLRDRGRMLQRRGAHTEELHRSFESVEVLSPERVLLDKQSLQAMLAELQRLQIKHPRAVDVFTLHRFEGLKHAEIAQIFGIATSTVEKDIMKIMAFLAKRAFDFGI
jgi:RNA polymerase sigma factor (sigma-70 family)